MIKLVFGLKKLMNNFENYGLIINIALKILFNHPSGSLYKYAVRLDTNVYVMNNLRNNVQLIGYLGKEVEMLEFEKGNKISKVSLATNEVHQQPGRKGGRHSMAQPGRLWQGCRVDEADTGQRFRSACQWKNQLQVL